MIVKGEASDFERGKTALFNPSIISDPDEVVVIAALPFGVCISSYPDLRAVMMPVSLGMITRSICSKPASRNQVRRSPSAVEHEFWSSVAQWSMVLGPTLKQIKLL